MDATFRVTPPAFEQVFTVLADFGSVCFPVGIAFMKRRTREAYIKVLEAIKEEYPSLKPKIIMSDFETAIIQASHIVWPLSKHYGCLFHFCQAFYRKIAGETSYNNNIKVPLPLLSIQKLFCALHKIWKTWEPCKIGMANCRDLSRPNFGDY